jgi:uncharacterized protein YecE (DUF72 family)
VTPGLRIGTSGWNYPTGRGTWNGIFYPPARGRPKGFDELAFYANHFNTVEVNSTFYGQPRPDVCRGWAERTPAGFEFSVKLYQKFTHPRMYKTRVAGALAPAMSTTDESDRDWLDAIATPMPRTSRSSAAASTRWRMLENSAPCLRSFHPVSNRQQHHATT